MKGRQIRYSAAELRFLEERGGMPRRKLHTAFVQAYGRGDVTYDDIKRLCSRRGWKTGRASWTREHDALLRELYPDHPTAEVARRLGRSVVATYGRANILGLAKSAAYMASPASCRLRRGDQVGKAHRFPKGHAPANKGLRRPGFAPGRMKETQFTAGQPGWNWRPVGSERVCDGYRYTKVSDHRRVPWTRNWRPTHVLRWEAIHGPLAKGMVLKSLDGNRQNVEPSNWEAIPQAMLPRLNGIHGRGYDAAPAELKPTIMAATKLELAARTVRQASVKRR